MGKDRNTVLIVSEAAILYSAIDISLRTGLSAVSFATNIIVNGYALIA